MPTVTSFQTSLAGLQPQTATSNTVTLSGILGITGGGTGSTTAGTATNALLPSQVGKTGQFLTTNGLNVFWAAASSATGSGTVTSITGSGGATGLTLSGGPITTSGTLTLGGVLAVASGGTGGTTRNTAAANILPVQTGRNGAVLATDGTNPVWINIQAGGTVTSVQATGGTTGLAFNGGPITGAGVLTLTGILGVANGGTGASTRSGAINALLPNQTGQFRKVLMTDGSTVSWETASSGSGSGTVISVNVSGGTTGLTTSGGPITSSGVITLAGTLNATSGGTGSSAVPTNGQIPIGNGTSYVAANITAGTGAIVTNAAGSITIGADPTAVVTSFSAGSTGLAPSTATPGAVTLSGILNTANGGTGLNTSAAPLGSLLIGNGAGLSLNAMTSINNSIDINTASAGYINLDVVTPYITIGSTTCNLGSTHSTILGIVNMQSTSNVPVADLSFVTKAYADALTSSLSIKAPAKCATTADLGFIPLGYVGLPIIDGYQTLEGDRVLVKNQTNAAQDGVFVATALPGGWAYPTDMNTWANYISASLYVLNGTLNADATFVQINPNPGTLGTSLMSWVQQSGAGTYTAGLGLIKPSPYVFAIADTTVVANTYGTAYKVPQISVNAQGQLTNVTEVNIAAVTTITGGLTGLTPATPQGGNVTLGGTLNPLSGGTGLDASNVTDGQLLIGNASTTPGLATFSLGTLTAGTGVTITNSPGSILIGADTSALVTSFSAGTTGFGPNSPTPGAVVLTGNLAVTNGGTGANNTGATKGQILLSDGANTFVKGSLIGGTGITVDTSVSGQVTIQNDSAGVILTWSGGLTGLTPASASVGNVILGGTLNPLSGGTGLDGSTAPNGSLLIGTGTGYVLSTLTAGSNIAVTNSSGGITVGLTGIIPIANGGTNASTANAAFNNLAPTQALNTGKFLKTDGTNTSWASVPSAPEVVYATTLTANSTLAAVLTAVGATDTAGFTYSIFNNSASVISVTGFANILNTASYTAVSTATQLNIAAHETVSITCINPGVDYNILSASAAMDIVSPATLGDIPTILANGQLTDSGKAFSDTLVTNNNIWSAAQTEAYVVQTLLNAPSLPPANVATTANVASLSGLAAIDGYTPIAGDIILVKNQTTSGQNGIYKAAAGAWTRQVYNTTTNAFQNISTETTYAQLNQNGGVINVLNGTAGKNLQFQVNIPTPSGLIASNGSLYYVQATTKIPVASGSNRFVDPAVGNNTNYNGSQSFPYASFNQALTANTPTWPMVITLCSSAAEPNNLTWLSGYSNTTVQAVNTNAIGGQNSISGTHTFNPNSTRINFKDTYHNVGANQAFSFQNNAAGRNYFQNLTIVSTNSDWLGLNAGMTNWITLDNISVTNVGVSNINLPAFTNPVTIYINNQQVQGSTGGYLIFTGTGSASTIISMNNCEDGTVRIPSGFLGTLAWDNTAFGATLGSSAHLVGAITTQADLTAVTAWTTDSTYDGFYIVNFAGPTTFAQGAIINKLTFAGVTIMSWARTWAFAPSLVGDYAGNSYQKNAYATPGYSAISGGTVPKSNFINVGAAGTIPATITGAGYTDTVGASYLLYNSTAGSFALTAGTFSNAASWPTIVSGTTLTLAASQSVLISTVNTAGTGTYTVDAYSSAAGGGASLVNLSSAAADTMSTLLSGASVTDKVGNIYAVTNTSSSAIAISATAIANTDSFPGYTAATSFTIPAKGIAFISTTVVNSTYEVISLSNSVSTNLSGGLVNQIPYQTAANTTTFIANVAGDSGKFLQSKGTASAPVWAAPPGDNYINISASVTMANLLTNAALVDVVGASYTVYNSGTSSITITALSAFDNAASFSEYVSGALLTLPPKETATIVTKTVNSVYAIESVSTANGVYTMSASSSQTLTALLTAKNINDFVGNIYTINNSSSATISLTATTFTGYTAYANQATATTLSLVPGGSAILSVNTAGSSYQIMTVSATGSATNNVFKVGATTPVNIPLAFSKVPLPTVILDPLSQWDAGTSRFTPKVAGYYQFNANLAVNLGSVDVNVGIVKNGVENSEGAHDNSGIRGGITSVAVSTIMYMNGTTDYAEIWGSANQPAYTTNGWNTFSGALITAQPAVAASNALARAIPAIAQSLTNNAITKVVLGATTYNPLGWMDTVNNSRFQPNVAGYYQVTGSIGFANAWSSGASSAYIFKNGLVASGNSTGATNTTGMNCQVTDVIYLNGSSDYLELFVIQNSGSAQSLTASGALVYFDCALVGGFEVSTGAGVAPIDNAFRATPASAGYSIGTNSAYPANVLKYPNVTFDPVGAYNAATGVFNPKTAGYYRVSCGLYNSTSSSYAWAAIYKNGVSYYAVPSASNAGVGDSAVATTNVYLNGTTDYLEFASYAGSSFTVAVGNAEISAELIGGVTSTPLVTGPQLFKWFSGISLGTYVNLPGDNVQVAWVTASSGYTIYLRTASGTITPDGIATYFRGQTDPSGSCFSMTFGVTSGAMTTITTTGAKIFTWIFNQVSDNLLIMFTDAATGYTYQIRAILGGSGNNNKFSIQRNISNA